MKPENEMTDEVRQLLDSLEEHGKNARRQKDLEALIDGLSEERKTENGELSVFHFPFSVSGGSSVLQRQCFCYG